MCPSIKDFHTINKALDKGVDNVSVRRNDSSILTDEEERFIVSYTRNKNRAAQGIKHKDCVKMVYDFLTIRSKVNKKSRVDANMCPFLKLPGRSCSPNISARPFGGRSRHVTRKRHQHQAQLVFFYNHVMYAGFPYLGGGGGGGLPPPSPTLVEIFVPPPHINRSLSQTLFEEIFVVLRIQVYCGINGGGGG